MMNETVNAQSAKPDNSTEVVILGGRYTIKSGFSPAFVDRTAALVNQKLTEIIRGGGVIASDKVAILACMNLASELLKLQEENQQIKDRLRKRLEKVLATLDTCLSQEELSYLTPSNVAPSEAK